MKRAVFYAVAFWTVVAIPATAEYVYEGQWGSRGTGDGGRCTFKDLLFSFNDGKLTATKHNYRPAWLDNVTIGE